MKVRVSVPATTSNLGPGFDCLGLALALRSELVVEMQPGEGEPVFELEGEGAGDLPRGRDNLIYRAFNALGRTKGKLTFRAVNRIPLGRGLGSSAAAAVAGLAAANALYDAGLTQDQLLGYATTLDGHPDNAAPALRGGLVACARDTDAVRAYSLSVHPDLRAVVCVPDFQLETAKARAALPATYLKEDAVHSAGRAALLAPALEHGRWDMLGDAMDDRLHQPYRAPLVKGFSAVLRAARAAGAAGACLSGAGPSMLALAPKSAPLEKIGAAMLEAFKANGVMSMALILEPETRGVEVAVER